MNGITREDGPMDMQSQVDQFEAEALARYFAQKRLWGVCWGGPPRGRRARRAPARTMGRVLDLRAVRDQPGASTA